MHVVYYSHWTILESLVYKTKNTPKKPHTVLNTETATFINNENMMGNLIYPGDTMRQ